MRKEVLNDYFETSFPESSISSSTSSSSFSSIHSFSLSDCAIGISKFVVSESEVSMSVDKKIYKKIC